MKTTDELRPACEGQADIHDSPMLADHRLAVVNCARCPLALFTACQKLAEDQAFHDGTWAGVLYVDGKVSRKGRRFWMANGMKRAMA